MGLVSAALKTAGMWIVNNPDKTANIIVTVVVTIQDIRNQVRRTTPSSRS